MGGEGPGGAWCKSNRAGMQGCSFSHLHPWTLQCHTFCPQDHPGNLLFLKSSTRPSFLPLGLLSVGALHLPEPPGGVCVGMGLGAGGRLGFDRQLGSWAALRRPPPPVRLSQLAPEGKRGWGQLHRETFVLAQNRPRLGTELPLGCHGYRGHLSSCLFSQCGFHGHNRP